ncbi:hypothetical protein J5N97_006892 [Dioscorea zingiberensis]|uniref:Photosynthetic NDH subcomplex B 4 n=1 Tax=Dioscorea zingiberensis TaxID=325984 RepID=A0A9D5DAU6_9LILI|nr:hypothetical protein J5N97_006892 [Dioscorea zingiberensis]
MVESTMAFSVPKPLFHTPTLHSSKLRTLQHPRWNTSNRRASSLKVNALPNWPLMAVMIEHANNLRDFYVHKTVWHLSDEHIKNTYTMYIMFTCWGCCFFGSTKDPFYDGEQYRKDGGDGTVHWYYEKQEDIEEAARAELWREELIEEIEKKVGGLRELEEAGKEEELV